MACGSHYSHFRGALELTRRRQFSSLCVRGRKRTCIESVSLYLTPRGCRVVAHARPLRFLCPCRGLPTDCKDTPLFPSRSKCLPATGHLGSGIPWRDGTGCCHVTGKKRQSHHMPKLLPSLYLRYGTPCKQQIPSNPLINYHVLTLI